MPSAWLEKRPTQTGQARFLVRYRLGGREATPRYAGSFRTQREALARRGSVLGELAAMRVPNVDMLVAEPLKAPTLEEVAKRWQASRVDVRESTTTQHRVALGRVLPELGSRRVDELTPADVAGLVAKLAGEDYARESIRKSKTALAMVLDFAGVAPNPARDRVQVRLPRQEPDEPEPPSAEHVEAVGRVEAVEERLPPVEDREADAPLFAGVTADRLRTALGRACKTAGVPRFSPHALRHRRISLLHRQGVSWAEIGESVGQRSRVVTADRYSHALIDYREVDRATLLRRVRMVHTRAHTRRREGLISRLV